MDEAIAVTFDPERHVKFDGLDGYVASGLVESFERVGSRVTCDPAPTDTDEDFLVLAVEPWKLIDSLKMIHGFKRGGSELVDDETDKDHHASKYGFASLKLGHVNLIITEDSEFYRRFLAASSVAKRLNLLEKADRIALFQAVLYGNSC